jgi:hypothetical protein
MYLTYKLFDLIIYNYIINIKKAVKLESNSKTSE